MSIIKKPAKNFLERTKVYIDYYNDPLIREWYFKHAKRLKKFKNIHFGQNCFIIGNGSSLRKMDLSVLANYHTFGVNKIHLIFDKVDLNLSYHVAVNQLVIQQCVNEFMKLRCPLFLSYKAARNLIDSHNKNIYFIVDGGPYTFHKDIASPIHEGHTVTYVALQIAYYMGFKNVFLIGVDHDYNTTSIANKVHFMDGKDTNHFSPEYFRNCYWQIPDLEASELSYHLARFFYNKAGRHIYDATVNGKLDIFPKISYEEALIRARS